MAEFKLKINMEVSVETAHGTFVVGNHDKHGDYYYRTDTMRMKGEVFQVTTNDLMAIRAAIDAILKPDVVAPKPTSKSAAQIVHEMQSDVRFKVYPNPRD